MPTDAHLLTLTQWLSPAYPVGAFAWSHGLEAAIRDGWVRDAGTLRDWLCDLLEEGSGRADAAWIGQGFVAETPAEVGDLIDLARAFAASAERRKEADRQGAAFAQVTNAVWGLDLPDGPLPVLLGRAARLVGLDLDAVAAVYLQGVYSNLVAAAQRLMPLGQTEGQSLLASLAETCARVAAEAGQTPCDGIFSNAFLSDIAAMRHETLQPRLFQS